MEYIFEHFENHLNSEKLSSKTLELAELYKAIMQRTVSTRRDYVDLHNLRSSSVSAMVGQLIERSLIIEESKKQPQRGRPTMTLHINYSAFAVAVIRISSQTLICSAVNTKGDIIAEAKHRLSRECTNKEMTDQMIALFQEVKVSLNNNIELARLVCSIPGILDIESSRWLMSSRWSNIRDLNIKAGLDSLGIPITVVRNLDCELIARTDVKNPSNNLLIHWGYGVGSAYNEGINPVNSSSGRFGEIGHWEIDSSGDETDNDIPCRCGKTGCVETKCGLWSLWPLLTQTWPDIARDEESFEASKYPLLEHEAIRQAVDIMIWVVGNLYRTLFPSTILLAGPFFDNADLHKAFTQALEKKGSFSWLPPLNIVHVSDSAKMELIGATTPLISKEILARLVS